MDENKLPSSCCTDFFPRISWNHFFFFVLGGGEVVNRPGSRSFIIFFYLALFWTVGDRGPYNHSSLCDHADSDDALDIQIEDPIPR